MSDARLDLLLHQLSLAFDRRSWHGPNLLGSLRGVTLDAATFRPQPDRHNVWELALHCAYWKYRVCRLLSPETRRTFSLKGSDWFERPIEATEAAWKADLAVLHEWHDALRDTVAQRDPSGLDLKVRGAEFTTLELISGAAAHDLYHAGQIRLVRRMANAG
ncbi:MAG: DinB family protein [Gemmatimonadaceae bacterium]